MRFIYSFKYFDVWKVQDVQDNLCYVIVIIIIWCTPSVIWWSPLSIIWWTGYIIWCMGYIIWWICTVSYIVWKVQDVQDNLCQPWFILVYLGLLTYSHTHILEMLLHIKLYNFYIHVIYLLPDDCYYYWNSVLTVLIKLVFFYLI